MSREQIKTTMFQIRMITLCQLCLSMLMMVSITSTSDNVGENLLRKIHTTSHERDNTRDARNRFQISNRPRLSVLDRARTRHQQSLGTRSQNRSPAVEPRRNLPLSIRNQLLGGECQAFQTENSILKQQLLAVQEQLQQLERRMGLQVEGPVRALQMLSSIQVSILFVLIRYSIYLVGGK